MTDIYRPKQNKTEKKTNETDRLDSIDCYSKRLNGRLVGRGLQNIKQNTCMHATTYLAPPPYLYLKSLDQIGIAFRSKDLEWLVLCQLMRSVAVPCALDDASDVNDDAHHVNVYGGRY